MLRQGRGAGFLAALDAGRRAVNDLLDCVLNDPRWDRQVEARDDYYARLLLATGADIDVLRQRIAQEDDEREEADFWLPIGVLAEMCHRGDPSARTAVDEGVEAGTLWRACLDALDAVGGSDLIEQVVSAASIQTLIDRVGIDDIADAVSVVAAPWKKWADMYRLCSIIDAIGTVGPEESLPFLAEVYEQAPYSYARRRVVSAMGRRCGFALGDETGFTARYDTKKSGKRR